ncbi:sensor histidine kinase [Kitasatospora sp. RB6PN24]|uniref:sensor histidine kinase n=1 Tax=Kitasatospora humi TaxID=2893891 RepID=UPI001E45D0E5|nr:sensor histidine kinase [Kitasatospora humi]MCC9310235.1 sensor histidine kinase [Kitasatospora humi]
MTRTSLDHGSAQSSPTRESRPTDRPTALLARPAVGDRQHIPGAPVDTRRQLLVKICWMLLWMFYLVYPIEDLAGGRHGTVGTLLGALALAGFVGGYLSLVIFRSVGGDGWRGTYPVLALMLGLAFATSFGLGGQWLGLFTYLSVAAGAVLPPRFALGGVLATAGLLLVTALILHTKSDELGALVLPTFLSGAAMTGLQRLVTTMRELREAREVAAHLAAAEERLRLARDMHDLLGHSLSLITLKSELAGRFMDAGKDDQARAQVADIEQVARQSLTDVRSAVSGYRKPSLSVELAAARTALATTGVTLDAPSTLTEEHPGLGGAEAETLAWALREAVTNVVRHAAGATLCTVALDETWDGDGARFAVLEVADNGRGPGKSAPGNGLTGLDERLALVGGRLETATGRHGRGFTVRALVPLGLTAARRP